MLRIRDPTAPSVLLGFAVARLVPDCSERLSGRRRLIEGLNRGIAALFPMFEPINNHYFAAAEFRGGGSGGSDVFTVRHLLWLLDFLGIMSGVALLVLLLEILTERFP